MEYNEWMPVGRGDPLKKDPTYDYSPPVLDRVRYWDSGNKDKSGDILLLGVSSKKASPPPHRQQQQISNNNNNNNNNSKDPKNNNHFYKNQNNIPMRRNYYMPNVSGI